VIDTLMRLSALAVDLRDVVQELDINPLFVLSAGKGVKAGDALVKPRVVADSLPQPRPESVEDFAGS
jgi:NAD(P)H-hydrate repair Nnr-like enzyme with NAD(P)H-hydrate epimerase domain